jgi:GNAT superfamily N-acetyltransferase
VNSGGSVGFLAPVTAADVAPVLDWWLGRVEAGDCALVRLEVDGNAYAGFAFLETPRKTYMRHWATVTCLQLDPELQGVGLGRALVAAVEDAARAEGLEALRLQARGGVGLEEFYGRCGYREIGRYPAAIRVAPGDDRDEVLLFREL